MTWITAFRRRALFCLAVVLPALMLTAPARALEFEPATRWGSLWGVAEAFGLIAAAGPGGRVLTSTDGAQWRKTTLDGGPLLLAVAVPAPGTVVAAGAAAGGFTKGPGVIYRSTDGGGTFSPVLSAKGAPFYALIFASATRGLAAGGGGLYGTEDGGQTWQARTSGVPDPLWALHVQDAETALAGGGLTPWQNTGRSSGVIIRTTDGGKTWRRAYSGGKRVSDFSFVSAQVGYAGLVGGGLLKTTDGGMSWRKAWRTPLSAIVNAIHFTSEACGISVGSGGTAHATTDGGKTWSRVTADPENTFLEDLAPASDGRVWVVSGSGLLGRLKPGGGCPP